MNNSESVCSGKLPRNLGLLGPREAVDLIAAVNPQEAISALQKILPTQAQAIVNNLSPEVRATLIQAAPAEVVKQWELERQFPAGSVGRLMQRAVGVFHPQNTVAETIEEIRELVKHELITYGFVVDERQVLLGVITMRDLLFCEKSQRLEDIMLRDVFALRGTLISSAR